MQPRLSPVVAGTAGLDGRNLDRLCAERGECRRSKPAEAQAASTNQGQAPPPTGKGAEQDAKRSDVFTTTHFCQKYSEAGAGEQGSPSAPVVTYPQVLGMDMEAIVTQACNYSLSYTSMTVPSVNLWAMQVKNSLRSIRHGYCLRYLRASVP